MVSKVSERVGLGAASVSAAVLAFFPLGAAVFRAASRRELPPIPADFAVPLYDFKPEPGERAVFPVALLFLFLAIFGFSSLFQRAGASWRSLLARAGLASLGGWILFLLFCLVTDSRLGWGYNVIFRDNAVSRVLPTLGFVGATAWAWIALRSEGRARVWLIRALQLLRYAMVGAILLAGLLSESNPYVGNKHFGAAYNSLIQASMGKVILADLTNHYGLYAQFLGPLVRWAGGGVFACSLAFVLLVAASIAALTAFAKRLIRSKLLREITLVAAIYLICFTGYYITGRDAPEIDTYVQYFPIRVVFPVFLLAFHARYLARPSRALLIWISVFCSAAVLWNLDSGLVTWLAWPMALGYDRALKRGVGAGLRSFVRYLGASVACLAVVSFAYWVIVRMSYGVGPNLTRIADLYKLFYQYGYYMLPMRLVQCWNLVALVLLSGLALSADALGRRSEDLRARSVFLLAVLGCGLFGYFQGRSHPYNLLGSSYVWIFLLGFFGDRLLDSERELRPVLGVLVGFLMFLVSSAALNLPSLAAMLPSRLSLFAAAEPSALAKDFEYLRHEPRLQTPSVLALTPYSAAVHAVLREPAPVLDSYHELFFHSELEAIAKAIRDRAAGAVVVDDEFVKRTRDEPGFASILKALETHYARVAESPSGNFKVYVGADK